MKTRIFFLIAVFLCSGLFARNPIIFPKTNNKVCIDKTCTIKWDSNYFFSVNNIVKIIIYKGSSKILTVDSTQNDGIWDWKVPANLQPGNNYRVFIKGFREVTDPEYYSGYFKVIKCGLQLARNSRGRPQVKNNNPQANVQKPDTSQVTAVDLCEKFRNSEWKLIITNLNLFVSNPSNSNSQVVGNITVKNNGSRCVRFLIWNMRNENGKTFGQEFIYPKDYGKSKWLLKAGEKITIMFSVPGAPIWQSDTPSSGRKCPDKYKFCKTVFVDVRADGENSRSNKMEAILGWAFEDDE